MEFVFFSALRIAFRVKPRRLILGFYRKLWYVSVDFIENSTFKVPPHDLGFMIFENGIPVYVKEIIVKIIPVSISVIKTSTFHTGLKKNSLGNIKGYRIMI